MLVWLGRVLAIFTHPKAMISNTTLFELRALALALASQPLSLRRHLLELVPDTDLPSFAQYQQSFPKINWEILRQQAITKIDRWIAKGIQITSIFEIEYPSKLKNLEDPPLILFIRGRSLQALSQRCCLAIVGSRRADSEGLSLCRQFATELAALGVVIVSGLALGIDGAAHVGALQSGLELPTVAVLGSGLDVIYPPQHSNLALQIIEKGGMIISQFEPEAVPYPSNFLNRNRVVSGLANAILVIEATLKSGSLVTARHALDQGKDVLVVPGDINNPRFEGSNRLIQQGAILVTCVQDIIEALGIENNLKLQQKADNNIEQTANLASKIEKTIVKVLEEKTEIRVDELLRYIGSYSCEKELLMLEMQGIILRLPGNILRLKRNS